MIDALSLETLPKASKLDPRHQMAMSLRFQDMPQKHIAQKIGVAYDTVRSWFKTGGLLEVPYREFCNRVMNPAPAMATNTEALTVADRLKEAAPNALESVIQLSKSATKEEVKLGASKDILDRAGYAPVQRLVNVHAIDEMSIDQLNAYVDGILTRVEKKTIDYKPVDARLDADPTIDMDQSAHALDVPDVLPDASPSSPDVHAHDTPAHDGVSDTRAPHDSADNVAPSNE